MKLALVGGTREADRLAAELKKLGVEIDPSGDVVVIAAHPFDTDLWQCAALSACHKPHIGLARPAWQAGKGDDWRLVKSVEAAAELLANSGAKRALLAVGNGRLLPFYQLESVALFVRSRNPPHPPAPPYGRISSMRGPFDVDSEVEALRRDGIDFIVAHNAGGQGGWPKLGAARALGLPVILIDRPKLPAMDMVSSVDAALNWTKRHMGLDDLGASA